MTIHESKEDADHRLRLERQCAEIGCLIADAVPGLGFAFFVFDLGGPGSMAYVANEWVVKFERMS